MSVWGDGEGWPSPWEYFTCTIIPFRRVEIFWGVGTLGRPTGDAIHRGKSEHPLVLLRRSTGVKKILTILHFFSSVAHVWVHGAKNYWADHEKVWFFLSLIFSAVRNFQFRHMFCRNKKFCSVTSRFPVHLP
jgi:hypothetical protein